MSLAKLIAPIILVFLTNAVLKAQSSALEIVKKSIALHDPRSQWESKTIKIDLREERPGSADRLTELKINNRRGLFELNQTRENHQINYVVDRENIAIKLDGKDPKDTTLIQKFRLYPERVKTIRDYYTFIYGLPMKIIDPGAVIAEVYSEQEFNSIPVYRINVSYDPQVGKDIWYFYFSKKTAELVGYQFYHDEAKNDGEYITLEGSAMVNKMRLPKKRNWYTNEGQNFLGTDIIVN